MFFIFHVGNRFRSNDLLYGTLVLHLLVTGHQYVGVPRQTCRVRNRAISFEQYERCVVMHNHVNVAQGWIARSGINKAMQLIYEKGTTGNAKFQSQNSPHHSHITSIIPPRSLMRPMESKRHRSLHVRSAQLTQIPRI